MPMPTNDREQLFRKLISGLEELYKSEIDEFKYIGTGNPMANILIIGKESSIDKLEHKDQYQREIVANLKIWKDLKDYDTNKIPERDFRFYSVLYPYKGQVLKRNNDRNWGTSDTWMNYQKLYDKIYGNTKNKNINFHEHIFITEVNSTPSRKTKNAEKSSIPFRKQHVLTSAFFQSFPIVIISGVGYFKINETVNEIESIFGVTFTDKKYSEENKPQPYWIHRNDDNSKIVINTYQLSNGVSDKLLESVAAEIKQFMIANSLNKII